MRHLHLSPPIRFSLVIIKASFCQQSRLVITASKCLETRRNEKKICYRGHMGEVIRSIKVNFLFCTTCSNHVYRTTYCPPFYQTFDNRFQATTTSFNVLSCSKTRNIVWQCIQYILYRHFFFLFWLNLK